MSLRDLLPPELQALADAPVVEPPDDPPKYPVRDGRDAEDAGDGGSERGSAQQSLFAAPVDPHTGSMQVKPLEDS